MEQGRFNESRSSVPGWCAALIGEGGARPCSPTRDQRLSPLCKSAGAISAHDKKHACPDSLRPSKN